MLLGHNRIVTITGSGGVGKTRLALEVAKDVGRLFSEVWFIDLGALPPTGSVPDAIAFGVGVRSPGSDVIGDIVEHIRGREVLLVMDSCEHVLAQSADTIHTLLRRSSSVRFIATSRARLHLKQEVVIAVATLELPTRSDRESPHSMSPAVQLFLDRAAQTHEATYTVDDLQAIADICRELDGLPLAIELAAARVKALTPPQILERLRVSFSILSGGFRDMPPRQRSIQLAIDWSYRLCSPEEQRIWREMSVFVGGWDLDAAEWVDRDTAKSLPTLDIVQSLLEKSILVRRQSGDTIWYSMLSTIRDFGLAMLEREGSLLDARERHRDWYQLRASEAERDWIGPKQAHWLALYHRELPNIRAALAFCVQAHDGDAALALAVTAWRICWQPDARLDELRRWLIRGLALSSVEPTSLQAQAYALLAAVENTQGDRGSAVQHLSDARSLADELDDAFTTSLVDAAEAELVTDPAEAIELYKTAIAHQRGSTRFVARANPSVRLSNYYDRIGLTEEAKLIRDRILEVAALRGEQYEASYLLLHAGAMAAQRGDIDDASDFAQSSLRLKRTLVNPVGVAQAEEVLASVAFKRGDYERAALLLGAAASEREDGGILSSSSPPFVSDIGLVRDTVQRTLGDVGFATEFEKGASLPRDEGIAWALGESSLIGSRSIPQSNTELSVLTAREQEVAALVSQGLSDRRIASALVISPRTAEGHVQRILVKLGLTSRTQLATWYSNLE